MRCRICGNEDGNRSHVASEMMFGSKDSFQYVQCAVCECLQIAAYPPDIARYYGERYYSFELPVAASAWRRLKTRLRDRYEIRRRGRIGRYLSERDQNPLLACLSPVLQDRKKRILEIGCGAGALLRNLHQLGFRNLTGADPFIEREVRISRSFVILKAELSAVPGQYDLIMFHHSMEHLPDQHEVFRQVAKHLTPDGQCVVRVPLCSSYAWERYQTNWVQLDAPRHFYLHSVDSLRRLAAANGLRLVNATYDSTPFQFWGSEQYERDIPLRDPRSLAECTVAESIFTREQMGEFRRHSAALNQEGRGDQAAFFFQHDGIQATP